jgi:hypothetical protein
MPRIPVSLLDPHLAWQIAAIIDYGCRTSLGGNDGLCSLAAEFREAAPAPLKLPGLHRNVFDRFELDRAMDAARQTEAP